MYHIVLLYRSGESFEHGECSLPPLEYSTRAFWIDISPAVRQAVEVIEGSSMLGGVHAAAHAILTVVTMILTVDPSDMDCEHVKYIFPNIIVVVDWATIFHQSHSLSFTLSYIHPTLAPQCSKWRNPFMTDVLQYHSSVFTH